ncbi:hypothetical protein GVAV_003440 [Gurleya vavrai]
MVSKQIYHYKQTTNKFKKITNLPPYRIKNLHLLFDNINSVQKLKSANNFQEKINQKVAVKKKKIIRKIAYDYVYNLLIYFADKYQCFINVEMLCYRLAYIKLTEIEEMTDWKEKIVVLKTAVNNYKKVIDPILEKVHTEIGNHDEDLNMENELLDKINKTDEKLQYLSEKNKKKTVLYDETLKNFENSMVFTIIFFDCTEENYDF